MEYEKNQEKERTVNATAETTRRDIISMRQAKEVVELMRVFYSDPKNQAAFEEWRDKRLISERAKQ